MVVFNLWWDYTLCRIVNLSHDESVVRENLENYSAVMLFRELCHLITKGMGEVVKSGSHVASIGIEMHGTQRRSSTGVGGSLTS